MKKSLVFFILVFLIAGSLFAQSSTNDQRIVGTWSDNVSINLILNANGSGSLDSPYQGSGTFSYGVSSNGLIYFAGSFLNNENINNILDRFSGTFYLSPDGRLLILDGWVFHKR